MGDRGSAESEDINLRERKKRKRKVKKKIKRDLTKKKYQVKVIRK